MSEDKYLLSYEDLWDLKFNQFFYDGKVGEKMFKDAIKKHMVQDKVSIEGICCVCHHKLDRHIDEGDGWRCHCLDGSMYQCECYLRKDRAESDISYYDFQKRVLEQLGVKKID